MDIGDWTLDSGYAAELQLRIIWPWIWIEKQNKHGYHQSSYGGDSPCRESPNRDGQKGSRWNADNDTKSSTANNLDFLVAIYICDWWKRWWWHKFTFTILCGSRFWSCIHQFMVSDSRCMLMQIQVLIVRQDYCWSQVLLPI